MPHSIRTGPGSISRLSPCTLECHRRLVCFKRHHRGRQRLLSAAACASAHTPLDGQEEGCTSPWRAPPRHIHETGPRRPAHAHLAPQLRRRQQPRRVAWCSAMGRPARAPGGRRLRLPLATVARAAASAGLRQAHVEAGQQERNEQRNLGLRKRAPGAPGPQQHDLQLAAPVRTSPSGIDVPGSVTGLTTCSCTLCMCPHRRLAPQIPPPSCTAASPH